MVVLRLSAPKQFKGITSGDRTVIHRVLKKVMWWSKSVWSCKEEKQWKIWPRKNSEKAFCSYLLIFDPSAYVLWPVDFQSMSSPQVQYNQIFKRRRNGGVKGLFHQPDPGEGCCSSGVGASSSSSSLRWRPQPMLPGVRLAEGLAAGNMGKKGGNM